MPRCVVCPSRSTNGIKMCYFPRDEVLRDTWVQNVNKINWAPTRHAALCELHFAPEMWEKPREDGTKKLKRNAIPTLFDGVNDSVGNRAALKSNSINHESALTKNTISKESMQVTEKHDPLKSISSVATIFSGTKDSIEKCEENLNLSNQSSVRKAIKCEVQMNTEVEEDSSSEEELEEERSLINLQMDFQKNITPEHGNNQEQFQRLQKLYETSERLRTIMKKKHRETRRNLQKRIKQLEQEATARLHGGLTLLQLGSNHSEFQ